MKAKRMKPVKAWAEVGSHGGIFMFIAGPVAEKYPKLLQVYAEKLNDSMVEVEIREVVRKKRVRRTEGK